MDAHQKIVKSVFENPGITFRQIERETGLGLGTIQYHLRRDDRLIQRGGGYVRCTYDRHCELSKKCRGTCLWRVIRDPTKAAILKGLAAGRTQQAIADELELDKSTISYHVSRLQDCGALEGKTPIPELERVL